MPVMRIEIPTTRDEAKKILALYEGNSKHRRSEDLAIDEAWKHDRTPTGRIWFAGLTNGQPPSLKFDVEVHTNLRTPR
ncbi:hypothetical protein GCM10020260_11290 [Nesterenkonia halobia]|uniref:Uncharacterized protein n=2 Tax=Nesterenkonia halobia TaxID=37922 RepID=A0ABP6RD36_9MICC